jgi:hypothetical protein
MTMTADHTDVVVGSGTTASVTNRSYGGSAQGCSAIASCWWESTTVDISSFNLVEPTGGDVIGEQAIKVVDTNLGVTGAIWFFSKQSLYDGPNLGFRVATVTFDGTVPANNRVMIVSFILTSDDLGVADSGSIVEQASGDLGPDAMAQGDAATGFAAYQVLLSNETVSTNLTPITGSDWANGGSNEAVDSNSKYHGVYGGRPIAEKTQWGSQGMVVGGGSGA